MNNLKIAKIGKLVMKLLFVAYTGYRNWMFLGLTTGGEQILQYLGLVATEGALVFWDYYRRHTDDGGWPRAIGLVMLLLSLVVVIAGVFAHMELAATAAIGVPVPPMLVQITVYIIVAAIGANLAAILMCDHLSSEQRQRDAALALDELDEEAQAAIDAETAKQVKIEARSVAAEEGPAIAKIRALRLRDAARAKNGLEVAPAPRVIEGKALEVAAGHGANGQSSKAAVRRGGGTAGNP